MIKDLLNVNDYFARPTYNSWAIYRRLGFNRAKEIYVGTEEQCCEYLKRVHARVLEINDYLFINEDYIYNLLMECMQRVVELKSDFEKEGLLDCNRYKDFTTENAMFREWCEEYEFEYRMITDPEDENFLETSQDFFKVKLLEVYGKR